MLFPPLVFLSYVGIFALCTVCQAVTRVLLLAVSVNPVDSLWFPAVLLMVRQGGVFRGMKEITAPPTLSNT